MYNLEHYDVMMELLYVGFEKYIASRLAIKLICNDEHASATVDSYIPNMVVRCSSCAVSLAFIRRIVVKLHGLDIHHVHLPLLPIEPSSPIQSNAYMFHVDISNQHPRIAYDYIVNVCQQKTLKAKRHLIVINIVENLKKAIALAIKSIINKYIGNALFVIRNDGCFHIDEHLLNSCQLVRLCLDHVLFAGDLVAATAAVATAAVDKTVALSLSSHRDPINMCVALELQGTPFLNVDPLLEFVVHHMDTMVESLSSPTSTLESYGKTVRTFCIKVGASCVPIATVASHILTWVLRHHGELYVVVLNILTNMEYATKCVSKPIFALEHNINDIVQHIVEHKSKHAHACFS